MSNPRRSAKIIVKEPEILKAAAESANEKNVETKNSGRTKIKDDKKLKHRVTLLLNDEEFERFKAKASDLPLGLFLKIEIKNQTDLLK